MKLASALLVVFSVNVLVACWQLGNPFLIFTASLGLLCGVMAVIENTRSP